MALYTKENTSLNQSPERVFCGALRFPREWKTGAVFLASQQRAGVLLLVRNPDKMAESLRPTPEGIPQEQTRYPRKVKGKKKAK